MIEIREGTAADILLIRDFIYKLAVYERLENEMTATEDQLTETLFGDRSYANTLIAFWDGVPSGFALYFNNYSTFLAKPGIYLEDLFVLEEYRGRGLGKALLKELAKICIEKDYGRLEWSVLDWNTPSIEFYKSLGAMPMDEWTVFRLTGDTLKFFAG